MLLQLLQCQNKMDVRPLSTIVIADSLSSRSTMLSETPQFLFGQTTISLLESIRHPRDGASVFAFTSLTRGLILRSYTHPIWTLHAASAGLVQSKKERASIVIADSLIPQFLF